MGVRENFVLRGGQSPGTAAHKGGGDSISAGSQTHLEAPCAAAGGAAGEGGGELQGSLSALQLWVPSA